MKKHVLQLQKKVVSIDLQALDQNESSCILYYGNVTYNVII